MVGGAMSGYCVTGSVANPIKPRMTSKMEITVDSTGRLINLAKFILFLLLYFVDKGTS